MAKIENTYILDRQKIFPGNRNLNAFWEWIFTAISKKNTLILFPNLFEFLINCFIKKDEDSKWNDQIEH